MKYITKKIKKMIKWIYKQIKLNYWIVTDDIWNEYFIFKYNRNNALSWDFVEINIIKKSAEDKKAEAEITKILSRTTNSLVGTFIKKKWQEFAFIKANNTIWWKDTYVFQESFNWAQNDDIVIYRIKKWIEKPVWEVIKILWNQKDFNIDTKIVLAENKIRMDFPDKVLSESKKINWSINNRNRLDLTKELIYTIDWEDAKDLDDAISVKINSEWNYILWVHIADVAEYVKEWNPIDIEAKKRWTSIYLPQEVIPMLPEKLSNDLCSLHPWKNKATLSIIMTIDKTWKVLNKEIKESIILSKARLTYTGVQQIIENKINGNEYSIELIDNIKIAYDLFKIMHKRRKEEWKIEFDFTELVIEIDKEWKVTNIRKRERNEAHKLIEEFMILANEEISKYFSYKQIPFLYRIHEKPDDKEIEAIFKILNENKIKIDKNENFNSKTVSKIIEDLKWKKEEYMISKEILQSMSKAKYDDKPLWHFWLSLKFYSHFTSPIRRYPDLQIHRIIKEYINKKLNPKEITRYKNLLTKVAKQSSENEQKAEGIERRIKDIKTIEYMERFIWEKYTWMITSMNNLWMYIELENWVEWYVMTKNNWNLSYNENNKIYKYNNWDVLKIWDFVKIKVIKADKKMWFLDFEIIQ